MALSDAKLSPQENHDIRVANLDSTKKNIIKNKSKKKITTRGWLDQYSKQMEKLDNITDEKKEPPVDIGLDDLGRDIL